MLKLGLHSVGLHIDQTPTFYFRSCFPIVNIQIRRNVLSLPSVDAVRQLLRSTAYYFPEAEAGVLRLVAAEIEARGNFAFEKNAYTIEGRF